MWRKALVLTAVATGVAAAQDAPSSATPDGHVRPLYPADPTQENHVAAGTKFEVRSGDDHEAFQIDETHGSGVVYAAFSQEPFKFDDFMRGDHWDQDAFPDSGVTGHEEAVLTDLVQHMATGAHFDYDLANYKVAPPLNRHDYAYADGAYDPAPYYYPAPVVVATYGASPWWYGPAYYDPFFYPYAYSPFGFGGGFGFGFGFGFGGCWGGCGFYGYHPGFFGRPGWGVGGGPFGVGYRGRAAFAAGRGFGGGATFGYRNRV